MAYLSSLLGLVILVAGAELLVRGAVSLAELARISLWVIGLTVVAFETKAPEFVVFSISSLKADSEIAIGNGVGSNILNVLLILGASALIVPLTVSSQLVKLDVPIMVAASIGVALAAMWWDRMGSSMSKLEHAGCGERMSLALSHESIFRRSFSPI